MINITKLSPGAKIKRKATDFVHKEITPGEIYTIERQISKELYTLQEATNSYRIDGAWDINNFEIISAPKIIEIW